MNTKHFLETCGCIGFYKVRTLKNLTVNTPVTVATLPNGIKPKYQVLCNGNYAGDDVSITIQVDGNIEVISSAATEYFQTVIPFIIA